MLSCKDILDSLKEGRIRIEPFDERHLGTNSYDVSLGDTFYVESEDKTCKDIYSEQTNWIQKKALPPSEMKDLLPEEKEVLDKMILSADEKVFRIGPGERILGHTVEHIGSFHDITTMLQARSSTARSSLSICMCAGVGDIGYSNRWTLEIMNHSRMSTFLVTNRRIGQILFFQCLSPVEKAYDGKYTKRNEEWKPEMMLPRFHLDFEVKRACK